MWTAASRPTRPRAPPRRDSSFPSSPHRPNSPSSLPSTSPKFRAPRFIDTFQSRILSKPSRHSPDSPSSSPTLPSKPKRKRRAPVLDPRTKVLRSQRHNEAEVRRRQRLNDLLVELAEVVECRKPQKSAILRITLEKVKGMERTIQQLRDHVQRLEADGSRGHSAAKPSDSVKPKEEVVPYDTFPYAHSGPTAIPSLVSGNPWTQFDTTSGLSGSSSTMMGMGVSPSPLPLSMYSVIDVAASPQPLSTLPSAAAGYMSGYDSSSAYPSCTAPSLLLQPTIKREPSPPPYRPSLSQSLLHASTVPMDLCDLNGRLLDCNQLFADFLGRTRAELLSATFFDFMHADSLTASFAMLTDLITNNRQTVRAVKRYVLRGGRVRTAQTTIWMCKDDMGMPNHVAALLEPMDEQPLGMESGGML